MPVGYVQRVGEREYCINPEFDVARVVQTVLLDTQRKLIDREYRPMYDVFKTPPTDEEIAVALQAYVDFFSSRGFSRGLMDRVEAANLSGLDKATPEAMLAVTFYIGSLFIAVAGQAARTSMQNVSDREGAVADIWLAAKQYANFATLPSWQKFLYRRFRFFRWLWRPPELTEEMLTNEMRHLWPDKMPGAVPE